MINYLIFISLVLILGILIYLLFNIKNGESINKGGNENIQSKLIEVSNDINKIELDLASVTTPLNELNRFLGGNVTTGRLGEWNLESIVRDIMPNNSFDLQHQINPESRDLVDCAVTTAEGIIVPIDSKFYAGQYQNYQDAKTSTERKKILGNLRTEVLSDATDISSKYLLRNITSNYVILYIPSEKLIDLINQIEGLREESFTEKNTLIMGPNTLAAFLDMVRTGHHYLKLNETASKVASVVRGIQKEFSNFDANTNSVLKRLDGAVKDVQSLQTRINVLGNKLEKGAESLEDES
ncbi:MAG: DNA recombination protein RmuC [Gammaproteobacteria bacterium]|jgi:DNA recombination protein RmuC|nr:DNA recombination protein RmuC [Gammaproteobacteria bacterium]|tara:strand:+ start:3634 stop:4521 length:888 start_codon:yes stop_codon:yes gene_type:complete